MRRIGRLHVLTDTVLQDRFSHVDLARMAIAGGADTIQFRQKTGSTREMVETALALRGICDDGGVTFIVNDRVDVAVASCADGVHLGQDDFPVRAGRDILGPDRIIGVSARNLEEARQGLTDGADYVGFGPIYTTGSKSDARGPQGLDRLVRIAGALPAPVIAIGGIGVEATADVIRAGAHGIAVISAVCCDGDPEAAVRTLAGRIEAAGDSRAALPEPTV